MNLKACDRQETHVSSGIKELEVEELTFELNSFLKGVFDGWIVGFDKVFVHELNSQTTLPHRTRS